MKGAIEVGADVAFVEGVANEDQLKEVVKMLAPTPVLVNIVVGGVTPAWTDEECERMGAKLIVSRFICRPVATHNITWKDQPRCSFVGRCDVCTKHIRGLEGSEGADEWRQFALPEYTTSTFSTSW